MQGDSKKFRLSLRLKTEASATVRRGLFISVVMHATLLAWAVFAIHKTAEFSTQPEAIAVAMITPSELLRLKQGSELSDRKSTRLNSSHMSESRMPSSA